MSDLKVDGVIASTGTNTNLTLQGKGSGKVAIGDGALLFPDADGSANQVIKTDGSGALAFVAAGGGKVLQVLAMAITNQSGTTVIPRDSTLPAVSEGTEVGTQAITLADDSNKVLIHGGISLGTQAANDDCVISLFRGSVCIMTRFSFRPNSNGEHDISGAFAVLDSPASGSEITYSLRAGTNGGASWYVNGQSSVVATDFGDSTHGGLVLQEIDA